MISKEILKAEEYDFIRTNIHLKENVILLGLSGSYSYGTNIDESDIDIRGIALNRPSDLIGLTSFEQYVDNRTDTCIYSFHKIITLLLNCNPNTIELLGLNHENYLYLSKIGQELLDNKKLFLSQRAVQSFGGYAGAQLRRLQNALARNTIVQEEQEGYICHSLKRAMYNFAGRYEEFEEGALKLYLDQSKNPEFNTEIFLDATLSHYPLRDYKNIWAEMNHIVKEYDKLGKRNKKKDDNHLNKHAMHLIRLFMMAIDILEKESINTYRIEEKELLLSIRNGCYQREDGTYGSEFYDLLNGYEKRLDYASKHTNLPKEPDIKRVEEFVMRVNEGVVRNEI